jgi:hypothetical protein
MALLGASDALFSRGAGSYADPNLTIAGRDIPTNIKLVFRLCRFWHAQDALLGAVVDKLSEYPVTSLLIEAIGDDELTPKARDKWDTLLNTTLDIRQKLIDVNNDRYCYGNSFWYIYYPFVRYCVCPSCNQRTPATAFKEMSASVTTSKETFSLMIKATCPKCGKVGQFKTEDRKSEARSGLNLIRMSPLRMSLKYNSSSGHREWYWEPPRRIDEGIADGDRTIICYTEMAILEAAHRNQSVLLNKDRLWVSQTPGMPGVWEGWGVPPLWRVLEDVYYYKILRRANEALAQEHVVPMRIISPAGTGDVSPQRTMNLTDWRNRIKEELQQFKKDPNRVMISPIPINVEQVGGQGRVMMVASEMEAAARIIAAGLGCPVEMIWGGLNWSGASVSLRVLENHFINDRSNSERFLGFLIPKISAYFRMPRVNCKLSEFRMADDVQQQGNMINLMLQGYLSRQSVVGELGYDPGEEFDNLSKEHEKLNAITMQDNVAASHMRTVIQMLEAKAQILMQYELQITQDQLAAQSERERLQMIKAHVQELHQHGYTSPIEFEESATLLARIDPNMQGLILQQWQQTMPNLTLLLMEKMQMNQQNLAGRQQAVGMAAQAPVDNGAAGGSDMENAAQGPYSGEGDTSGGPADESANPAASEEPLPEAKPPRRSNSPM